jgi:hypothetical protein
LIRLGLLKSLLDLVSLLLYWASIPVTNQVVKDKICVGDDKTERHSESFYTTVKLAFTTTNVKRGEAPFCFQNPKLAESIFDLFLYP